MEQVIDDVMDPARGTALLATLGRGGRIEAGDPQPPFAHHCHFWDIAQPDALGFDGHPKLGGFLPDLGLPHRMWAGGALRFHAPLRAGTPAQKISRVANVAEKTGRSGKLAFVTVEHEVRQGDQLCVIERQDIVYRAASGAAGTPPEAPKGDVLHRQTFDEIALFRYSALTFNGHRIHYDLGFSRDDEGYPGLIVHGPLLAQCLMLAAQETLGGLTSFEYRATSPAFAGEEIAFCRDGARFWAQGPDGRLLMQASAEA